MSGRGVKRLRRIMFGKEKPYNDLNRKEKSMYKRAKKIYNKLAHNKKGGFWEILNTNMKSDKEIEAEKEMFNADKEDIPT